MHRLDRQSAHALRQISRFAEQPQADLLGAQIGQFTGVKGQIPSQQLVFIARVHG